MYLVGANSFFKPTYRRIAQNVAPAKGKLLDLGCGPGWLCIYAASIHPDLDAVGIDVSEVMLRSAARNRHSRMNCSFALMDATHVVYPDGFFDVATAVRAAHTWRDTGAVLAEAFRVLKPLGRLVIFDPDPDAEIGSDWVVFRGPWPPIGYLRNSLRRYSLGEEGRSRLRDTVAAGPFGEGVEDRFGWFRRMTMVKAQP
jgi:ubiquinone/menaquinone biosynthesis C-methylase UbiE